MSYLKLTERMVNKFDRVRKCTCEIFYLVMILYGSYIGVQVRELRKRLSWNYNTKLFI